MLIWLVVNMLKVRLVNALICAVVKPPPFICVVVSAPTCRLVKALRSVVSINTSWAVVNAAIACVLKLLT